MEYIFRKIFYKMARELPPLSAEELKRCLLLMTRLENHVQVKRIILWPR
jgi:uncharacterized protein YneF (UPF0154 family)